MLPSGPEFACEPQILVELESIAGHDSRAVIMTPSRAMWRRLVHVLVVSWPVAHAGVLVRSKTAQPEDELSMLKTRRAH